MKKINGRTPPKGMTKEERLGYYIVIVSFMSTAIIIICLCQLYDQNKKIELTESCNKLMQYRKDVKLNTRFSWYWRCEIKEIPVPKDTLDFIIKHYQVPSFINKKEV